MEQLDVFNLVWFVPWYGKITVVSCLLVFVVFAVAVGLVFLGRCCLHVVVPVWSLWHLFVFGKGQFARCVSSVWWFV